MGILINTEFSVANNVDDLRRIDDLERSRPLSQSEVVSMLIEQQINTLSVDDDTALRMVGFYPEWILGTEYSEGYKCRYNEELYRCITAHTSTTEWTPVTAPSLWAKVLTSEDGTPLPWIQPDSTNAYAVGDKVTHSGKTWISTVDNNIWEPGVYGWEERIAN